MTIDPNYIAMRQRPDGTWHLPPPNGPDEDDVDHRVKGQATSTSEAGWTPIPLPVSLTEMPPRLHDDSLVGLVGEIAKSTVDLIGCDPLSAVIHLIGIFGTIVPPGLREQFLRQPGRDYILPVGRTGITRKGTTFAAERRLVKAAYPKLNDHVIEWSGGSGEGLVSKLEKNENRALLFADEFGQILAQAQRTGQTMLAAVRTLWNPEGSADIATRSNPVHIDGAHVSGIFHTTPEEVQSGFRTGEITSGTVNRLLVARLRPAERRDYTSEYPSDVFERLTSRLAVSVVRMDPDHGESGIVGYSPAARTLWEKHKPALDDQAVDQIGGAVLVRGAGHVCRLALITSLIEGHTQIEEPDLRAALAIWDACRHSAMLLFGALTGDRDADRIYGVLMQHGGELTRTDLRDALGRHGRGDDTEHGLVVLASRGLIRRFTRKTGGRPVERISAVDLLSPPSDISAQSDQRLSSHMSHKSQGSVREASA